MKHTFSLYILLITIIFGSACAPQASAVPTPTRPAATPLGSAATQTPIPAVPTQVSQPDPAKQYANSAFGLSFQYPPAWFGPDEYIADQTLRVSVGSDVVYPYGTDRTEQTYTVRNSYYVVIQYTKNDQNQYWKDTYQSIAALQDGESLSDARSLVIRERQLTLGRFTGFEYISTLSETAQTEPVYIRQVILYDEQTNLLTIMGTPNNVDTSSGSGWRDAYRMVDQANLDLFHQIVESIKIE